ncbi:MAG: DmsC/YnfH family molybdoenzyme membrane anchor subunit, partial [Paracoccaceae bacterium]
MHPAPSVILFTVLSGMGFGALAFLGLGLVRPEGWGAFALWGLAYGLAVGGLLASAFHLGNPQRALLAFTQWRTSWLSREAWAAVAALVGVAPVALSDWLGLGWPRGLGLPGVV